MKEKKYYINKPIDTPKGPTSSHVLSLTSSNKSSQIETPLFNSNAAPSIESNVSSRLGGSRSKSINLNNRQVDELVEQVIFDLEQLKKGKNYLEEYQNTCRELLSAIIDYNNSGNIYCYKGESTKHEEKCKIITELCWKLITSGKYSPNLFTIIMKIFKDRTTEGDC